MKMNVDVPESIVVSIQGNNISVKKGDLELTREFPLRLLSIKSQGNNVDVESFTDTAKSKAMVGTFRAHINNMIKGVTEPFVYKLKICSAHFPMTVKQSGNIITVSNFLGEKKPKKVKLIDGVKVKVDGDIITVSAANKESAGTVSSRLEQSTRLNNKDRRIFQDGIFMINKAGKDL
jgi:large subunit ribosomal protein L6